MYGLKALYELIEDIEVEKRSLNVDLSPFLPFKFRSAPADIKIACISESFLKPYFDYIALNSECLDRLLEILEYFGLNSIVDKGISFLSSFVYTGLIKLQFANIAFERNHAIVIQILMDCIDLEYTKCWRLCEKVVISNTFKMNIDEKNKLVLWYLVAVFIIA